MFCAGDVKPVMPLMLVAGGTIAGCVRNGIVHDRHVAAVCGVYDLIVSCGVWRDVPRIWPSAVCDAATPPTPAAPPIRAA